MNIDHSPTLLSFDKRFMYEPCLTTPLVLRYPAEVPAVKVVDAMVLLWRCGRC
ncbi:MAG: sulfatase/phosphatase domain-containing protein [Planctomycetota bacterium]